MCTFLIVSSFYTISLDILLIDKEWRSTMKKVLLSGSMVVFLFFGMNSTVFAVESVNDFEGSTSIETRSPTFKINFKGIPPKFYNGKPRINYYKIPGGYTGVYSRY